MELTIAQYEFLGKLVLERQLTPKQMGVNQKIFSSWKRHGLIPVPKNGKWSRANFVEVVWIRILENMRRMNCSVATMKKAYELFFLKAWNDRLADRNRQVRMKAIKERLQRHGYTVEELYKLHILQQIDKDVEFRTKLDEELNYLYELLTKIILYGGEGGLLIDSKGDCTMYYTDINSLSNVGSLNLIQEPLITIPISHILAELLQDNYGIKFLYKNQFVSEDELRVIKEIRNKNVQSITVTKDEKESLSIISDERGLISGEQAKKIMQILGIKNYSSIELKTRNNSTLSFTKSNRV
jgi:hypothetical protein